MHISFPGQYRFIGITVTQAAVHLQSFDITCTCTAGTEGCSPYTNPKAGGCVTTGNCTTCTQKNSASIAGEDIALSEGAIIDLSQDIHFITNKTGVSRIPPAYASLFMDSTVLQSLRSFVTTNGAREAIAIANTSSSGILPPGYVYLPVSLFARPLLVPVRGSTVSTIAPLDFTPSSEITPLQELEQPIAPAGGYTCSCSSGGTGCTRYAYYIPFLGTNYFCRAGGCMSCTLHTPQ